MTLNNINSNAAMEDQLRTCIEEAFGNIAAAPLTADFDAATIHEKVVPMGQIYTDASAVEERYLDARHS